MMNITFHKVAFWFADFAALLIHLIWCVFFILPFFFYMFIYLSVIRSSEHRVYEEKGIILRFCLLDVQPISFLQQRIVPSFLYFFLLCFGALSTFYVLVQIIAAGPFTTVDNLFFEPLAELLSYARRKQPQLIILVMSLQPSCKSCNSFY